MISVCGIKIWGNEKKYLNACVDTGWFSPLGPFVKKFEALFAEVHQMPHAIACSNEHQVFTLPWLLGVGCL